MENDRIFYCYDCSAKLECTHRNVGGYDIYRCPQCEREGRQKRYRLPENAANFAEYRNRIDAVYTKIDKRRGERAEWEDEIIRISKDYSYAAVDPQFILLEAACYTENFRDPLDLGSNYNYVNDRYNSLAKIDNKDAFPLNNNGVTMFIACKRWLEKDMERSEYDRLVRDIYNRPRICESRKQSRNNFKADMEKLLKLDTLHNDFTKDDPVYHLTNIIVYTHNFRRRLPTNDRDYLAVQSEYEMIKKNLLGKVDVDDERVLSECENWLETNAKFQKIIIIASVSLFAALLIGFVIFTFAPRTLSTEENVGGISVEIDNKALPAFSKWNISLQVDKAEKGEPEYENANSLISEVSDRFELYDISLVSDQKVIQPGGTVKVTMHIPESFSSQNIAVYHVVENRKYKVEATVKDSDTVVFETNHFSFYAIVEIPYSVVFTDNFGHSVPDQKIYGGNKAAEPSAISQEGQDFLGWYCDGEKWDFANDTVSRDVVLVASWAPHRYTVTYAANKPANASGTVKNMPGDSICEYGDTLTLGTAPTLVGWVFGGWFKDATCSERVGNAGTPLSNANLTAENNGIVTLYAKWIPTVYTVNYDGNKPEGSSGDVTNVPKPIVNLHYDDDCTLANAPRLVGWTFLGWYRDAACTVKAGGAGESLTKPNFAIEENVTLYAKWKANTYTVRFDSRGGECSLESKKVEYDSSIGELPIPLKPGFSFMGWFPSISGGNEVKSNDKFTFDSNITLYAHYCEHVYNANFETFGGSLTPPQAFGFGETVKKPEDPTRAGYTFDGWYKDPEYAAVFDFEEKNYQSVTVYAKWLKNTYVVSYDGNKPYNASGDIAGLAGASDVWTYDESATLAPEPSLVGWTFNGWYKDVACSERVGFGAEILVNPNFATEGAITLYAGWIANSYTVVYDSNGGDGNTEPSNHVYDLSKALNKSGYTYTGRIFLGWNTIPDGSGTSYCDGENVINITSEPDDVVTLYAQWAKNAYTVIYDSNGGVGFTAPSDHAYDVSKKLTPCDFIYIGRTFVAWNTKADGSGTAYYDEQSVINLTSERDGIVTLYAQWCLNTCDITYNLNDHIYGDVSKIGENNTLSYEITKLDYAKATTYEKYYSFDGWFTSAAGGVQITDATGNLLKNIPEYTNEKGRWISETKSLTLYAHWSQTEQGTYICDANGFASISKSLSGHFILINNIDLSTIGMLGDFSGELDGNGYQLYNWNYKQLSTGNMGIFKSNSGSIHDLTLKKCTISNTDPNTTGILNAGILCGENKGTIKNITVTESSINVDVGNMNSAAAQNYVRVGGICGQNSGNIYNCAVKNSVFNGYAGTQYEGAEACIGGVVGYSIGGSVKNISANNNSITCTVKANVDKNIFKCWNHGRPRAYVAGLIGYCTNTQTNAKDSDVSNNTVNYTLKRDCSCSSNKEAAKNSLINYK